jgi:signal transduction histidine kinase
MRRSLFWTLLGINLLVVGVAVGTTAVLVGRLADAIFASLMQEFHIQTDVLHGLFTTALWRSLVLASLAAVGAGVLLSVVLFVQVIRPVRSMMTLAGRIAGGDYGARVGKATSAELGSLAESLDRMAESLARLERLRKDLVANVAHELRTPLTNLRGYLEAVREGVTPPSVEVITSLHDETMRLVRLVDGLHALSQFDARLPHVHLQEVDLGELVRRLLTVRRAEFDERQIVIRIASTLHGPVRVDPDLLAQAVGNLLDNAAKYTPAGGDVAVEVAATDAAVRVAVANSGEGIPAGDLPFIFERFYRGEKSRSRESGGAGIGLAIVKEVASAHGGNVGASSEGGRTTVWLTVPADVQTTGGTDGGVP